MSFVSDLRYRVRTRFAAHPAVYFPLYRALRARRVGILCADTQFTIEGFPRSGNSFAVHAFHRANPQVVVAHHTHAAAQVVASVCRRLPVLVLVRDPEAAVKSFALMRPDLSPATIAWAYAQFHAPVLAHLDALVIATFEEMTRDFGLVVQTVNRRFDTGFREFVHDAGSVAAVFAEMEAVERTQTGGVLRPAQIAKPHAPREAMKAALVLPDCAALRAAREIHAKLLACRQPLAT